MQLTHYMHQLKTVYDIVQRCVIQVTRDNIFRTLYTYFVYDIIYININVHIPTHTHTQVTVPVSSGSHNLMVEKSLFSS